VLDGWFVLEVSCGGSVLHSDFGMFVIELDLVESVGAGFGNFVGFETSAIGLDFGQTVADSDL